MTVLTMYQSSLDESRSFTDKKEADTYDKQLQLGSSLGEFIYSKFPALSEEIAEDIGVVLAGHKEQLLKALKGKPEALTESANADVNNDTGKTSEANTTPADTGAAVVDEPVNSETTAGNPGSDASNESAELEASEESAEVEASEENADVADVA